MCNVEAVEAVEEAHKTRTSMALASTSVEPIRRYSR